MKTLVFSDSHLTDRFDNEKYQFLTTLLDSVDKVIINGDFWDGYGVKFDKFINSEWKKLFPLLKSKDAVYTFGNHDQERLSTPQGRDLFSTLSTDKYELEVAGNKYVFIHGQQATRNPDLAFPFLQKPFFNALANIYFTIGTALFKENLWQVSSCNNKKTAQYGIDNYPNKILVAGHTHLVDNVDGRYINSGVFHYGEFEYIIIDDQNPENPLTQYRNGKPLFTSPNYIHSPKQNLK